ncbi:ferrous iron transporter B [Pseudomonas sp. F1_0610]|uniref:ferrous iron transporter B n=1 Tax=Pseudomonas sp. F1_0610 TaxID=3114284 RepID=UPI0039C1D95B
MVIATTFQAAVRDELFATFEDIQRNLESFLEARDNPAFIESATSGLQQVCGILNVLELNGAGLLAQELEKIALKIQPNQTEEVNAYLLAIGHGLHILTRYIEQLGDATKGFPELLIPEINQLKALNKSTPLPESYFFTAHLNILRPAVIEEPLPANRDQLALRLRQWYQLGLLEYLRQREAVGARKMTYALTHLDKIYPNTPAAHFYWLAGATLESFAEGKLSRNLSRIRLMTAIDTQIKASIASPSTAMSADLEKELLYLVVLAQADTPLTAAVRQIYDVPPLSYSQEQLIGEADKMQGPSPKVFESLIAAVREEVASIKEDLDLIERGTAQVSNIEHLRDRLDALSKTLTMIDLEKATERLKSSIAMVAKWSDLTSISHNEVLILADSILDVEGTLATLERSLTQKGVESQLDETDNFAKHQLIEAHIVVCDEARIGIAAANRAIMAYLESAGDKTALQPIPESLRSISGGLWFLGQTRASGLVKSCADYLEKHMINADTTPDQQQLDALADALTGLEYFLESDLLSSQETNQNMLDVVANSLIKLIGNNG